MNNLLWIYGEVQMDFRTETMSAFSKFPRFVPAGRRIKRVSGDAEKLFGRYDELVRLVLGFVLTAVVGTYLSHRYTTQQADLSNAARIFSEYSKLVGDRYFAMSQLNELLRARAQHSNANDAGLDAAWLEYKKTLRDWNSARGFSREMIRLYFGASLWNQERDLHYQFRAWGQSLEAEYKSQHVVDFECVDHKIDSLLTSASLFRAQMAEAMQAGAVGASRPQTGTKEHDRPEPWCLVSKPIAVAPP